MNDSDYVAKLIAAGVKPRMLLGLSSHQLDCVGNIVGVYRTSMREQNPIAFEIYESHQRIEKIRRAR